MTYLVRMRDGREEIIDSEQLRNNGTFMDFYSPLPDLVTMEEKTVGTFFKRTILVEKRELQEEWYQAIAVDRIDSIKWVDTDDQHDTTDSNQRT